MQFQYIYTTGGRDAFSSEKIGGVTEEEECSNSAALNVSQNVYALPPAKISSLPDFQMVGIPK